MDDLNQTVSNLGYIADAKVSATSELIVKYMTNIDIATVTAFQDSMIQFSFSIWLATIYIILRGK